MNKVLIILCVGFSFSLSAQEIKVWTLKECVNYALENNVSVKQTILDRNAAVEDVKAAKYNFLPNLNASASHRYDFGSSISALGARASADFRSNNFSINSSMNIFNGFANINTLKQSNIGVQVQEATIAKMKNDISLNVVNGYLQILFAKERLRIAESQKLVSENEVKRVEELVGAGVLPKGDLLNMKSTLASDHQSLIVAQNNLTVAKLQLAQLLQLNQISIDVEDIEVDIKDQEILGSTPSEIFDKANTTFPEIKMAELNIMSAEKGVQISKSSFYPSLTMNMGMNTVYQHAQGIQDPPFFTFSDQVDNNFGQSVSLSLNIPIFNRYQFRNSVNKAKINVERIQYNLESEKLRLRETIQNAYADALASSKSYEAAIQAVEAQNKAFDYAKDRFALGTINSFDFNQNKNSLLNAEAQLVQSKYDFMFKLKVLEFYFGVSIID